MGLLSALIGIINSTSKDFIIINSIKWGDCFFPTFETCKSIWKKSCHDTGIVVIIIASILILLVNTLDHIYISIIILILK